MRTRLSPPGRPMMPRADTIPDFQGTVDLDRGEAAHSDATTDFLEAEPGERPRGDTIDTEAARDPRRETSG